jgi:hypothetical protein
MPASHQVQAENKLLRVLRRAEQAGRIPPHHRLQIDEDVVLVRA